MKLISLDNYFNSTRYYFYFFDSLFKIKNRTKKEILELLNIPDSTYRTNRLMNFVKNDNISILLNFFRYNKPKHSKEAYEDCLNNILNYLYYYNEEELDKETMRLDGFIRENNYLKPIFILIKILEKIITKKPCNEEDLNYLAIFNVDYFDNGIKLLRCTTLKYFSLSNNLEMVSLEYFNNPNLKWFCSYVLADFELKNKRSYNAVFFFNQCLLSAKDDFNIDRAFEAIDYIVDIYISCQKYEACILFLEQYINKMRFINNKYTNKIIARYCKLINSEPN